MNLFFKTLIKCIGVAVAIWLGLNFATFLLGLALHGFSEAWGFHLQYGAFSLNGEVIGLKLGARETNGLLLFVFIAALAHEFRRGAPVLNAS